MMVRGLLKAFFVLGCLVLAQGGLAAPAAVNAEPSVATVVAKLQERYSLIERMKSQFKQESYNASMGKEQAASGAYYAEKPGKVRWDYEKPEPQHLLIANGRVEFYVPGDKQLVVSKAGEQEELKAVLDLLGGKQNVMDRFKARLLPRDDKKSYCIRIVPKTPMGNLLRLDLSIDKKTYLVVETDYWDIYGNRTRVFFSHIETPKSFDSSLFKLNIPKGVSVMDTAGNPLPGYPSSDSVNSGDTGPPAKR